MQSVDTPKPDSATAATAASPANAGSSPSPVALRLGYAGLIPFVVGALMVWLVQPDAQPPEAHPFVVLALSAYAAVIISFLGGIHWGLAMRHTQPPPSLLVWGVVPSLVAWVAVMMPPEGGLVIQALMLLACYAVDRRLYPAHGVTPWLVLRFRLSAIAAMSCFIGAAGA
jgi:hypothetical protein